MLATSSSMADPIESSSIPRRRPARNLADKFGAQVVTEDAVWADPDVRAIVIGSATATHADLIEKGLKAGKAVFCEKPIDLSMARVDEVMKVVGACEQPSSWRSIAGLIRGILEMKRRIVAGEIGALELVTVVSKDPGGGLPIDYLKISGGMFRDMTVHDFDMARYIMGEEFVTIQATAAALCDPAIREIGDIDTASVSMQTASGKIAVITNSRRASYGYDQRVEAHGALGDLRNEKTSPNTCWFKSARTACFEPSRSSSSSSATPRATPTNGGISFAC